MKELRNAVNDATKMSVVTFIRANCETSLQDFIEPRHHDEGSDSSSRRGVRLYGGGVVGRRPHAYCACEWLSGRARARTNGSAVRTWQPRTTAALPARPTQIAYNTLTETTREKVDELIGLLAPDYPQSPDFTTAGCWPDDLKTLGVTQYNNWHFVDLPVVGGPVWFDVPAVGNTSNNPWAVTLGIKTLASTAATMLDQRWAQRAAASAGV